MSLWDALGVPTTRVPLDLTMLVWYVLPPVICYFLVAMLAVTPHTRTIRVAIWPVVASLALRAGVYVGMSSGRPEDKFYNICLILTMVSIVVRTLDWALAKELLVRHLRPANSSASTIMDAFDLITNLRGHGWEPSREPYIPPETRPVNRTPFVLYTFLSGVAHTLLCGAFHRAILSFVPVPGSSIFDETLPSGVRCFRASIITALTAFMIHSTLQMAYNFCTIPAILLLGQDPVQWPPAFDAPWRATSLSDFWGRRWHQWFFQVFFLGGYALSLVLGRAGKVIGSFLSSAIFHHITMMTLDGQSEFWRMFVGFGTMAPGILAERLFLRLTERRVDGVVGWAWTMTWLLIWGSVIADGFARAGMFGCSSIIDSASPVRSLMETLIINFDSWLHTI